MQKKKKKIRYFKYVNGEYICGRHNTERINLNIGLRKQRKRVILHRLNQTNILLQLTTLLNVFNNLI